MCGESFDEEVDKTDADDVDETKVLVTANDGDEDDGAVADDDEDKDDVVALLETVTSVRRTSWFEDFGVYCTLGSGNKIRKEDWIKMVLILRFYICD